MIKLDKLSSGGNPLVYYYDVSGGTWGYGSYSDINTADAAPPSKKYPGTAASEGGLLDHVFIVNKTSGMFNSITQFEVSAGDPNLWNNLTNVKNAIGGYLTSATKIYMVVTELEYIALDTSGAGTYTVYHIGLDIYVA